MSKSITQMTLDECQWAYKKEQQLLDGMIKNIPFATTTILQQERVLESLEFWIERKTMENN